MRLPRRAARAAGAVIALCVAAALSHPLAAQITDPVAAGVAWLNSHQNLNGTWGAIAELTPRDTARAVRVEYLLHSADSQALRSGVTWLEGQSAMSPNEFLADQAMAIALAGADNTALLDQLSQQHSSVGPDFGGFVHHDGDNLDSALAIEALVTQESRYEGAISGIVSTLLSAQNADGGWGIEAGFASDPVYTSEVLVALTRPTSISVPATAITSAQKYLVGFFQSDGSLADNVLWTAIAMRALALSGYSVASLSPSPLSYLKGQQTPDGSWGIEDVYLTARVLEAFATNKPNLVIPPGGLVLSAASATEGTSVTAKVTVFNYGAAFSGSTPYCVGGGCTYVYLYEGSTAGTLLGKAYMVTPPPGASTTVSATFAASAPLGPQTIVAVADAPNVIDETTKADNTQSAALTVNGKPDLEISSNDIATNPAHLQPNQAGQVLVTIHNIGQADASNVGYAVYDGSGSGATLLAKSSVALIPAGGSQVVSVDVALTAGTHVITAIADPDNLIAELSESNNQASRSIAVSATANVDLQIAPGNVTVSPKLPPAGTSVTVSAIVQNLGTDPVQSSVSFYDGVPGAGGVVIATLPVSLAGAAQTTLQTTYTTTATSKVIWAVADPANLVAETDETNNAAYVELTNQFVDLSVSRDGTVLPVSLPSAGQTLSARVVVRNTGLLDASQAEVVVYDDLPENGGVQVADAFVDVPAGGKAVVPVSWTARAGQRFVTVAVNPSHSIAEPDYTNNRVAKPYSISGRGPDIYVATNLRSNPAASIDASGLTVSPVDLTVSGILKVTVHMSGVSQPYAVTLFEDVDGDGAFNPEVDNPLGSTIVEPGLDPQTIEIAAQGIVRFAPGRLLIYLDSGNSVVESNEGNNVVDVYEDCLATARTFNPQVKWSTPTIKATTFSAVARLVDTNGDGVIDQNDIPTVVTMSSGTVYAYRGDTGALLWSVGGLSSRSMSLAVGDVDGDGVAEVIAHADFHRLVCISASGQIKWTSPELDYDHTWDYYLSTGLGIVTYQYIGAPQIADLNGDGHVEVISGRSVLDGATGQVLWTGTAGRGRAWANDNLYWQNFPDQEQPIAVDLNGDGKLEVVAGNTAYNSDGSILWYRSDLPDGYAAALTLPSDPLPKICLVANGNIYLLNHDGTTLWGPVPVPGGALMGGAPTVFMNGTSGPFVGVAGDGFYSVLNASTGAVVWTDAVSASGLSFNTALNSATAFDFGAGVDLVYQSADTFWILRASDGATVYKTPNSVAPYIPTEPPVANIDNSGRAEIIVPGQLGSGLRIVGDPSWNGAPAVFNQTTYHVANVSENGAIPAPEIATAFSKDDFRANAANPLPATAPLPNPTASLVRVDTTNFPASVTISARVGNNGWASIPAGMPVAFYDGDPSAGGTLVGVANTTAALAPSDFEDVSYTWTSPASGSDVFYVVADSNGGSTPVIAECNASDDEATSSTTPLVVDVATDSTRIYVSDTSPMQGETIDLQASATLTGSIDASQLFAEFFLGDPNNGGTPISGYLPVQVQTVSTTRIGSVSFSWAVTAPVGPAQIWCVFDPQNLIKETDETNNAASLAINVTSSTPVEAISGTLTLSPPTAESNTPVAVSALVQNIGNVALTNATVTYSVSGAGAGTGFTGSALIAALAKGAYAEVALGSFTASQDGTYTVTLGAGDPAITVTASPKTITIGPFATAAFTVVPSHVPVSVPLVQCHVHISRTNTIDVPDDPLETLMLGSLNRAIAWDAPVVLNASNAQTCFRCHVQGEGLTGLLSTEQIPGVSISDAAGAAIQTISQQLYEYQNPLGRYQWGPASWTIDQKTATAIGAWALAHSPDRSGALPHLTAALDYLVPFQNNDGSFDCDDCLLSFSDQEATTMMDMASFAQGYAETGNPVYQRVVANAVAWAMRYNYQQTLPENSARVAIGLDLAMPAVGDPNGQAAIEARVAQIATFLRAQQNPDGSFGTVSTPDIPVVRTAQCLYALTLSGAKPDDPQVRAAVLWLINHQQAGGGWVESLAQASDPENFIDPTSWAMMALPSAYARLSQFNPALTVTLPTGEPMISSNIPPNTTAQVSGGTGYTWTFPGVTEQGQDIYFNVELNGIAPGEVRAAAGPTSIEYSDPYSGNSITHGLEVPTVTGFAPLSLSVSTDQPSYAPSSPVTVTETVGDLGGGGAGITNDLVIQDANGLNVATVASASPVNGLPPTPFPGWHYGVPASFAIGSSGARRTAMIPIDFGALLSQLNVTGTFDPNSIRISSDADPATEWYFEWSPRTTSGAAGQLTVGIPDSIASGTTVDLHVFFDVLDNGQKPVSMFDESATGLLAGSGLSATYWKLDTTKSNRNAPTPSGLVFLQPPVLQAISPTSAIYSRAPGGVPGEYWATVWTGELIVPADGTYQFQLSSDDGSWFYVDGNNALALPGEHGIESSATTLSLTAGPHPIKIEMFNWCCGYYLAVLWAPPGQGFSAIPPQNLLSAPPVADGSSVTFGTPEALPTGSTTLTYQWNTGATAAGPYKAVGTLRQYGAFVTAAAAAFSITPNATFDGSISTDRPSYAANQTVNVAGSVSYVSGNTIENGVSATLSVLSPAGAPVASTTSTLPQLSPGQNAPVTLSWPDGSTPAGTYQASLTVKDSTGTTLVTKSVPFTILPTSQTGAGVAGTLSTDATVYLGDTMDFAVTLTNSGNSDLTNAPFEVEIIDPATQAQAASVPFTASIPAGGTFASSLPYVTTPLQLKTYTAFLVSLITGSPQPLANTTFQVLPPPLKLNASVGGPPRVLLWANCSPGNSGTPCTPTAPPFLTQTLAQAGIPYVLVGDEFTFLADVRTGSFSEAVIYEPDAAEPVIDSEYLRDIEAGMGLLLIKSQPDAMPKLAPALGVSFKGVENGPVSVDLLGGPFTQPGNIVFNGNGVVLSPTTATPVAVVDGTQTPAITLNQYGAGRVVVVPFDTELTPTPDAAQLLLDAVDYVTLPPGSSFIGRQVVPVDLAVTAPPGNDSSVTVTATLPPGASLADASPEPSSLSPLTWNVTIPGGAISDIYLWVELPDALGTYTLSASAGFAGQPPLVESSVTLTVSADEPALVAALSADLQALGQVTTSKQDAKALADAVSQLALVEAVTTPSASAASNAVSEILQVSADLDALSVPTSTAQADADRLLVYWQSWLTQ